MLGWPSTNFDGQVVITVGVVSVTDYVLVTGKPCRIGDSEAILVLNAIGPVWADVVLVLVSISSAELVVVMLSLVSACLEGRVSMHCHFGMRGSLTFGVKSC